MTQQNVGKVSFNFFSVQSFLPLDKYIITEITDALRPNQSSFFTTDSTLLIHEPIYRGKED